MTAPSFLDAGLVRALVEGASDGLFVTDAAFRIEWVNRRGCELLGRPLDELVGRRIQDFMAEGATLNAEPLRQRELAEGRQTLTERVFERPDGSRVVLEVSASAIAHGRLLGIARDVTELHDQRDRLARSEASFRALIESSPDGIVVHRRGTVVYANEAIARMLGFDRPWDMQGRRMIDHVHPDDREKVLARVRDLDTGLPTVPFTEERLLRRDGSALTCNIGGVHVLFEGHPSTLAVVRDVTEQRRMEAQLAQSERMASLGVLAAGVAHEINNPLAYVVLHLEAIGSLATRGGSGETLAAIAKHAASAAEGAERVRTIVRDLRILSHGESSDVARPADVGAALETAIGSAAHEIERRARLERAIERVPPVVAGEGRLTQVFLNLLLNAAQAIPDGDREGNVIRVRTSSSGSEVRVAIEDSGVGIPPERMRHLFEPFYTTKAPGEGSGLGLAICHGIVTAIGGRIEVESVPGRGSTFVVVLPAASGADVRPVSSRPPIAPAARRLRVLVIDDEQAIVRALAAALGDRHDVVTASSGEEAIEILTRDDAFDAIVCDVLMPRVGGEEVHAWVTQRRPALEARMLFMSGGRIGGTASALAEHAAARWIEKPFPLARLERMIERVAAAPSPPP